MVQKRPDRTFGAPHDTFWEWCGRGELRLQRCSGCGELSWPAVASCGACGSEALEWAAMSGEGKVVSWCTFERDYYQGAFPIPWTTILVELAEGPYFLSEPGNFAEQDIAFGMPVKVAFRPCEDSKGVFNLPVFEVAGTASQVQTA